MALYSSAFLTALSNNSGAASILTGVAAGAGSVAAAHTGGVIYLFNSNDGSVPATADTALNTSTTHTYLGAIMAVPTSNFGVTFDTDAYPFTALVKKATETWGTGTLAAFLGVQSASTTLPITFMRFCNFADETAYTSAAGAGLSTTPRIQMTVGTTSASDIILVSTTVTVGSSFAFTAFQLY